MYRQEPDSFPVSQTPGPGPYFSLPLVTKSLVDLFLIILTITFLLFVDPFPVVFTVLSSVISDMSLVLLTIGSPVVDESFLVNFLSSFTSGLENLSVFGTILFLSYQDFLFVIYIISFIVDLFTGCLLVILQYMSGATHLV